MAGEEQLQRLVEQARGRHTAEQRCELRERRARGFVQRESELGRETRRAQHAHRVLAVPGLRIADQSQHALADIVDAARVVPHREIGDVVIKRIRREIAPPDVLVDRAIDVVAQNASALVVRARVVELAVVFVVNLRRRRRGTECRDLDDLVTVVHVGEAEAPPDQPAVAKQPADVFRQRVSRDVKILGLDAEQQVADAAADEERLVTSVLQAVEHLQCRRRNLCAGNWMRGARYLDGIRSRRRRDGAGRGRAQVGLSLNLVVRQRHRIIAGYRSPAPPGRIPAPIV